MSKLFREARRAGEARTEATGDADPLRGGVFQRTGRTPGDEGVICGQRLVEGKSVPVRQSAKNSGELPLAALEHLLVLQSC